MVVIDGVGARIPADEVELRKRWRCFAGSRALAWESIGVSAPAHPSPGFRIGSSVSAGARGKDGKIYLETSIVS